MMPEITYYRASDHCREVGGPPLFTRAEIKRIRAWLAADQLRVV